MDHHPDKKEFQVERLVLFSDAVFAIAITLLIIEIKVPAPESINNDQQFWEAFNHLWPKFGGFALSFFLIGLYWSVHHRMFGFVVNYTRALIWLNLGYLFAIVLMPFSTAVYSEFAVPDKVQILGPFVIYVFNICLIGIFNYFLWRYIANPSHLVADGLPPKAVVNASLKRSLVVPAIFLLSLVLCIWWPGGGRMVLFAIPFAMRWVREMPKKPKPAKASGHLPNR